MTQNYTLAQLQANIEKAWREITEIKQMLEEDLEKFLKGNQTAGTRVRKGLQEIKSKSQEIRVWVQDIKNKKKQD